MSEDLAMERTLPEPLIPQTLEDVIVMQRAMALRIDAFERTQERFSELLLVNAEATARTEKNTGELVELFATFKTGFKALNMVAKVIAPFSAIAGAGVALWTAWSRWKGGA